MQLTICIHKIWCSFRSLLRRDRNSAAVNGNNNIIQQGKNITINAHAITIGSPKPISEFVSNFRYDYDYITFPRFDEFRDALLSSQARIIRLIGLSGLGKTRLIYEIFKDNTTSNYYCYHSSELPLLNQLKEFVQSHENEEGIVVLDDCSQDMFDTIIRDFDNMVTKFRIVAIYHYPDEESRRDDVSTLVLSRQDMRKAVDDYIDKEMQRYNCQDTRIPEKLKAISDGFPEIAYKAVEIFKQSGSAGMIKDTALWGKFTGDTTTEELKCLRALALFDPLGNKGDLSSDYNKIIQWEDLTTLYGKSPGELPYLFHQVSQKFHKRELIEQNGSWLTVRPLPFAVWLVAEWLKDCDSKRLEAVVAELSKPENTRLALAFQNRIKYMRGNAVAEEAMGQFMTSGSPFFFEGMICSDFGSRLLLAITYVNPVAVCSVLSSLLTPKDVGWVETHVIGNARSNLVWCVERLCQTVETFPDAVLMMAKLSLAENAKWKNNSTGQLRELFHVVLSGTSVNLDERYKALKSLYEQGEVYIPAVITALNGAFDYGYFTRTEGISPADDTKIIDYNPGSGEVYQYWTSCVQLVEQVVSNQPSCPAEIAQTLTPHIISLGRDAGCWELSRRLFDVLCPYIGDGRKKLRKQLMDVRSELSQTDTGFYDEWIEALSLHTFEEELEDEQQKFRYHSGWKWDDEGMELQIEFFRPLAESFVERQLYKDHSIVKGLIDNTSCQIFFIIALQRALGSHIQNFFNTVIECLKDREKTYCSSFVVSICNYASQDHKMSNLVDDFLGQLQDENFNVFYTAVAVYKETGKLNVLNNIMTIIAERHWNKQSTLETYLNRVPIFTPEQMLAICRTINSQKLIIDFILRYSCNSVLLTPPLLGYVEQFLVDYEPDSRNLSREIERLAENILKKTSASDFALRYTEKVIDEMGQAHSNYYDDFFYALLPNYQDTVLDVILSHLADKEYYCSSLGLAMGSGAGFGIGPLFQCDNDKIKDFCLKESKGVLPERLAEMAPVFSGDTNLPSFSDFLLWMFSQFNHFNDKQAVLDAISTNIGTFSWVGSIVPLYEKEKKCFQALKGHPEKVIRTWSEQYISYLDENIQKAKDEEYARSRIS